MSKQMVKETRKKAIAREKAEESARERAAKDQANTPNQDDDESDEALDATVDNGGWLEPEARAARRKAKQMRGLRTPSVENLENDDLNHLSAERTFVKSGGMRCPNPFGRKLIEDRLVGVTSAAP